MNVVEQWAKIVLKLITVVKVQEFLKSKNLLSNNYREKQAFYKRAEPRVQLDVFHYTWLIACVRIHIKQRVSRTCDTNGQLCVQSNFFIFSQRILLSSAEPSFFTTELLSQTLLWRIHVLMSHGWCSASAVSTNSWCSHGPSLSCPSIETSPLHLPPSVALISSRLWSRDPYSAMSTRDLQMLAGSFVHGFRDALRGSVFFYKLDQETVTLYESSRQIAVTELQRRRAERLPRKPEKKQQ